MTKKELKRLLKLAKSAQGFLLTDKLGSLTLADRHIIIKGKLMEIELLIKKELDK